MRAHLAAVACAAFSTFWGCTPPTTYREPDEYLGCGTDENWRTFDDREQGGHVKTDDQNATFFTAPAQDAMTFPGSSPTTFLYQPSATVPGKMNGDASCPTNCSLCANASATTPCNLCGDHLPAVSGDAYDLQFSVGGAVAYRVITTLHFYTPPASVWSTWQGKTVSLSAIRAFLHLNAVANATTDGPFQPTKPLTFHVGG